MDTLCMIRKTWCRHQHPLLFINSIGSSVLEESKISLHSLAVTKFSNFFIIYFPLILAKKKKAYVVTSFNQFFCLLHSKYFLLHFSSSSQVSFTDFVSRKGHKKCRGNMNGNFNQFSYIMCLYQ